MNCSSLYIACSVMSGFAALATASSLFFPPLAPPLWGATFGVFTTQLALKINESYPISVAHRIKKFIWTYETDHPYLLRLILVTVLVVSTLFNGLGVFTGFFVGGVVATLAHIHLYEIHLSSTQSQA